MTANTGPFAMPEKAKAKASGSPGKSGPRKAASTAKPAPKAAANANAGKSRPRKLAEGKKVAPARSATKSAKSSGVASGSEQASTASASQRIDQRISDLGGWRGETLARMRALILEADPEMVEECKWVKPSNPWGVPVWSHNGIVCTGESYAKAVKLTFARGASVPDPARLFNSSLEGNLRRAIDIHEGQKVDASAFKALIKAAVAVNGPAKKR